MRPRTIPTGTVSDLRADREAVFATLAAGDRHLLAFLRDPDTTTEAIPLGDLLSHAPGLGESIVARVLHLAKLPWSKRVGILSAQEIESVCGWIKELEPETWKGWRATTRRDEAPRPTLAAVPDEASLPAADLPTCEQTIERALVSYAEAGAALRAIRDQGLYKQGYSSFEEYCRERWRWSKSQAYRQIDAAAVYETIERSPIGDAATPPRNEATARELVPFRSKPAQLTKIWRIVVGRHGPEAQAAHVRSVVAEILPARNEPEAAPSYSVDDAVSALRRMTSRGYDLSVLRQALDAIDTERAA